MIIHYNISPTRPTILIVDDDPAVCNSLKFCLEIEGFRVGTHGRGADLLSDSDLSEAGCLVVDYHLPDMNGLELLLELRRRRLDVPTIRVTTNPSAIVGALAIKAGALLIEKPLRNETLFESIRAAIKRAAEGRS